VKFFRAATTILALGIALILAPPYDAPPGVARQAAETPTDHPPSPPPSPYPPGEVDAKAMITTRSGKPVPETWPLGTPMILSARNAIAGGRETSRVWIVEPEWVDAHSERDQDGMILNVATGIRPKTITVTLSVAKGDTQDRQTVVIRTVVDPDEPVDPTPVPPAPPPTPPPAPLPAPSPLSSGAEKVHAMLGAVVDPRKAETAAALAAVYRSAMGKISRAVAVSPTPDELTDYATPDRIVSAVGRDVRQTLGTSVEGWRPFFAQLRTYMNGLNLATAADYISVFDDIAAGLQAR
jgi:hypothetical protein